MKVPDRLKVSCGFPGCGDRKTRIGECWTTARQIFISPMLAEETRILDVLCHELIHACLPPAEKHGPPFKQGMKAIGLEGKAKATVAGTELLAKLKPIVKTLGPYPHKALDLGARPEKKQSTRLLKTQCPACGYIARVTRTTIDEKGLPICPVDNVPFEEAA
jgi:hypothetical protein